MTEPTPTEPNPDLNIVQKEPVISALITTLVVSGLAMAASFGVSITDAQRDAITAFVVALVSIVTFVWARSKVTPTAKLPS